MARSVILKPVPYVLESDRGLLPEEQSVFHVLPKTIKTAAESVGRLSKVSVVNHKKRKNEVDLDSYNDAENKEFLETVVKVENYIVGQDAPEGAYEYFLGVSETNPNYETKEGEIVIHVCTDKKDLLRLFRSMDPNDAEEISKVSQNYSLLKEGEKN